MIGCVSLKAWRDLKGVNPDDTLELPGPLEPRGYDPYNSCDSYDMNLREFRLEYPSILKRQAE